MPPAERLARQFAFLDRVRPAQGHRPADPQRAQRPAGERRRAFLGAVPLRHDPRRTQQRADRRAARHEDAADPRLVEIDAGDTFAYDTHAPGRPARTRGRGGDRIFGLLPDDQAAEFRALWDEFEARQTPDAKFAHAIDRCQAMLLNCLSKGVTWSRHNVHRRSDPRPQRADRRRRGRACGRT